VADHRVGSSGQRIGDARDLLWEGLINIDRMAQLAARDAADVREKEDRIILASAIDKIARKYERLSPESRHLYNETIMLKLTIRELFVLKQLHTKMHDD
jgi:hypothetical protein